VILLGDSLELLRDFNSGIIDLILTDPPYGITNNQWDKELDLSAYWFHFKRILKPSGVVVLTASQPFSSKIVVSNLKMFKHEWIWQKNRGSNFANTVREPFKEHEHILVFANERWTYNPQMQDRTETGKERVKYEFHANTKSSNYKPFTGKVTEIKPPERLPSSIQKFNTEVGLHPTQKPTELLKYLIKTYSNEGDLILDPFMGSGTTLIAAQQLNRKWIGIEINPDYVQLAKKRLTPYIQQQRLEQFLL
jgi:site-specific DNA-methyltransferase (adenine-specific)